MKEEQGTTWIHSRSFDLSFFIVSFLVGPLCYVIFLWITQGNLRQEPSLALVTLFFVLFTAVFDAPHIFSTFFRTHADGVEFRRRPRFHMIALAAAVGIAYACWFWGVGGVFVDLLAVYGGWHILRQNTGFLKLYSRKNREAEDLARARIHTTYWIYAFFLVNERNSLENILTLLSPVIRSAPISRGLDFLWLAVTLGLLGMAARMVYLEWIKYESWRHSSALFFYAAGGYFIALSFLPVHLLVMTALSTIAHDIQYQSWMWTYHRRLRDSSRAPWMWLGGTMILGILLCSPLAGTSGVFEDAVSTGYNGLVLWHYFIDGQIWAFSSMPELSVMSSNAI